jgi:hypothetical protein
MGAVTTRKAAHPLEDFFSVPAGYVGPGQGESGTSMSPVPPDAYDHPGKWLALCAGKVLAIRDTEEELEREFGDRSREVSFFHVPTTTIFAR